MRDPHVQGDDGLDTAPSDAELITRVRGGDRSAFGDLYERHARAAATLARQFSRSAAEADDLVSEAFARVLDTLLDGRGPDSAFRAYLFTALRNTAYDRTRKDKRLEFTDDLTPYESAGDDVDPVLMQMENGFVAKAFAQLPERWRTVLWHTQVEGQSAAEVGILLGMAPNAVSSLAFRAREGLREAYLQVHMTETVAEKCRTTINRLGAWTRGGLSKREHAQVEAHLAECDRCPALAAELAEVNSGLRGLLAPLLLGSAAAGYLASLPAVPVLTRVGSDVLVAGHAGGSGVASPPHGFAAKLATQPVLIGSGVAAAVAAVVIAFAVSGSKPAQIDAAEPSAPSISAPAEPQTAQVLPPATTTGAQTPTATPPESTEPLSTLPLSTLPLSTPPSATDPAPTQPVAPPPSSVEQVPSNEQADIAVPAVPGTPVLPGPPVSSTAAAPPATAAVPSTIIPSTPSSSTAGVPTSDPVPPSSSTPTTQPSTTPPSTTPTTTGPTTPKPTPASVTTGTPVMPASLVAGGGGVIELPMTNTGGTDSPGTPLILDLPNGVRVSRASLDDARQGLRSSSFGVGGSTAAEASICPETAGGRTACTVPPVPAGSAKNLRIELTVDPAAEDGSIGMTLGGRELGRQPIVIGPGYAQVGLTATSQATAGSDLEAVLTATPVTGVSNPGPITFPAALTGDMLITRVGTGCVFAADKGSVTCAPSNGTLSASLRIAVLPTASGQAANPTVALPGNRQVELDLTDPALAVTPRAATDPIELTGPFGGTMTGAATHACSTVGPTRQSCSATGHFELLPVTSSTRAIQIPDGAKVVSATLTWAATSAGCGCSGLSDVDLVVSGRQGTTTSAVTATADVANTEPGTAIVMKAADVTALFAGVNGDQKVAVENLDAGTVTSTNTPMGAWMLSVIWQTGKSSSSTRVDWDFSGAASLTAAPDSAVVQLRPAGTRLTALWVAVLAPDPWALKSVTTGAAPLIGINGREVTGTGPDGADNGFSLVSAPGNQLDATGVDPLASSTGVPIQFRNESDGSSQRDQVWIGPVLSIRAGN